MTQGQSTARVESLVHFLLLCLLFLPFLPQPSFFFICCPFSSCSVLFVAPTVIVCRCVHCSECYSAAGPEEPLNLDAQPPERGFFFFFLTVQIVFALRRFAGGKSFVAKILWLNAAAGQWRTSWANDGTLVLQPREPSENSKQAAAPPRCFTKWVTALPETDRSSLLT